MSRSRKQPINPFPDMPRANLGNKPLACPQCEHLKRLAQRCHSANDMPALWEAMKAVSYGPSIRCERCDKAKQLMEPEVEQVGPDHPTYFKRDDAFHDRMMEVYRVVDPDNFSGKARNY